MRQALFFVGLVLSLPCTAWAQGDPLGPEFQVNTYTLDLQVAARVAADPSGNFVVVWESLGQDGSSFGSFGQRYSGSGAPLGPEFRANTFTTGSQPAFSVAADAAGNFIVVWQGANQDGSAYGVFGQRFATSGIPLGPEFRANTYTTAAQGFPAVASDAAGNFVIVWQSDGQDGSNRGVFGQRYASSGAPLGPEFRVNTTTTGDEQGPAVAAEPTGNFVVVWTSPIGSTPSVFGQRYASSGAPLGSQFLVNSAPAAIAVTLAVAADAAGDFVVVWAGFLEPGSYFDVHGRRFASSGAPLGPEFRVNTFTPDYQSYPSVASDPVGNFVVVWASDTLDGSDKGVFGQRYLGSGVPVGPEFRVNTYTTNYQSQPSVAADASGNFVVVWHSVNQDGSSMGVFGQRYGRIVPVELTRLTVE